MTYQQQLTELRNKAREEYASNGLSERYEHIMDTIKNNMFEEHKKNPVQGWSATSDGDWHYGVTVNGVTHTDY